MYVASMMENVWWSSIGQPTSTKRVIIALRITMLIFYSLDQRGSTAQLMRDCQYAAKTNVTFLVFLPCNQEVNGPTASAATLEECDLLTRAAVDLAIEKVNQDQDVLTNSTLSMAPLFHAPEAEISYIVITIIHRIQLHQG